MFVRAIPSHPVMNQFIALFQSNQWNVQPIAITYCALCNTKPKHIYNNARYAIKHMNWNNSNFEFGLRNDRFHLQSFMELSFDRKSKLSIYFPRRRKTHKQKPYGPGYQVLFLLISKPKTTTKSSCNLIYERIYNVHSVLRMDAVVCVCVC